MASVKLVIRGLYRSPRSSVGCVIGGYTSQNRTSSSQEYKSDSRSNRAAYYTVKESGLKAQTFDGENVEKRGAKRASMGSRLQLLFLSTLRHNMPHPRTTASTFQIAVRGARHILPFCNMTAGNLDTSAAGFLFPHDSPQLRLCTTACSVRA
jgi:hypothetical protein